MFVVFTMRFLTPLLTLAAVAKAHYNFPSMNGGTAWSNVRQWTDYYAYTPVTNVSSLDIRCNVNGTVAFAPSILSVAAGSTLTWTASPDIYHPGPLMAYMAKVPTGKTAANWDGSGTVWFKIYEDHPTVGSSALIWPSASKNSTSPLHNQSNVTTGATSVSFKIPVTVPSGNYLFRIEHIGLHVAQSVGGAQFYISCGQLAVTGGGSGKPSPTVAFPGAYTATDPGILLDIYYPIVSSPFQDCDWCLSVKMRGLTSINSQRIINLQDLRSGLVRKVSSDVIGRLSKLYERLKVLTDLLAKEQQPANTLVW